MQKVSYKTGVYLWASALIGNLISIIVKLSDKTYNYSTIAIVIDIVSIFLEISGLLYQYKNYCAIKKTNEPNMKEYVYITLREYPELKDAAAKWFNDKWNVPVAAYLNCMEDYLSGKTEYGWYLCIYNNEIVSGLGVIENDFHNRKDLTPNICAVYTQENYRNKGLAGHLLNMAVEDLRSKGVSPVYLVTDHINFYEKYGWEFMCMVQNEGDLSTSRMYIHR